MVSTRYFSHFYNRGQRDPVAPLPDITAPAASQPQDKCCMWRCWAEEGPGCPELEGCWNDCPQSVREENLWMFYTQREVTELLSELAEDQHLKGKETFANESSQRTGKRERERFLLPLLFAQHLWKQRAVSTQQPEPTRGWLSSSESSSGGKGQHGARLVHLKPRVIQCVWEQGL